MASQRSRARRLLKQRQRAAERAPPLSETVRGTLRERYVRCGKPGCHCRKGRGHGPVRYLSVSLGAGQSHQITISAEDYELARQYVENYERLWGLLEQISTVNRELLQQRLLTPDAKGGAERKRRQRKRRSQDG